MKKHQRDIARLARSYGLRVENGSKHLKVFDPTGRLVAVAPRGSRGEGGRGFANLEAAIRRFTKQEDA